MQRVDRITYFKPVLSLIKNDDIRNFCEHLLNNANDYFFEKPASSTGKYHPEYSLGEGGLARHSMSVALIANDIINTNCFEFTDDQKDMIICAAIVHDIKKYGEGDNKYTTKDHPELAAKYIINESKGIISDDYANFIAKIVETHMGQYGNKKPVSNSQKLLHIADCLSSRRYINIDFNKTELPNVEIINESKITPNEDISEYVFKRGKHENKKISDVYKTDRAYLQYMAYEYNDKSNEISEKSRKYLELLKK